MDSLYSVTLFVGYVFTIKLIACRLRLTFFCSNHNFRNVHIDVRWLSIEQFRWAQRYCTQWTYRNVSRVQTCFDQFQFYSIFDFLCVCVIGWISENFQICITAQHVSKIVTVILRSSSQFAARMEIPIIHHVGLVVDHLALKMAHSRSMSVNVLLTVSSIYLE